LDGVPGIHLRKAGGKESRKVLEQEALTERIIGCAIEVHRVLGPGFVEAIYEEALTIELTKQGLRYHRQHCVPVFYDGTQIGQHRLDLLIEDEIVVELKAVRSFEDVHFAVVRSYLKALGKRHGLLLNFSAHPLGIRRVISP